MQGRLARGFKTGLQTREQRRQGGVQARGSSHESLRVHVARGESGWDSACVGVAGSGSLVLPWKPQEGLKGFDAGKALRRVWGTAVIVMWQKFLALTERLPFSSLTQTTFPRLLCGQAKP